MRRKPLILTALTVATLATGCKQSNMADENPSVSDTNSLSVTQQMENAKDFTTNAWQKTEDATTNAWASVKEGATNTWADIKDSMQSATDYTYDKKDAFVANASTNLDALDQKIKELSDKAAMASDSVKSNAQIKLQGLQDQRAELGKKLDEVKNASETNWNEVKVGFEDSYDDVKASLKQAWQWLSDKLNS
jgi:hypothetical protein